jgi:hypothetical protein
VGGSSANLLQCNDLNTILVSNNGAVRNTIFTVTLKEGFAASFKRRDVPPLGATAVPVNGFPAEGVQNIPGYAYNTESGLQPQTALDGPTGLGLADTATRFLLRFNSVNTGASLFVPTIVPLTVGGSVGSPPLPSTGAGTTGGFLRLVSGNSDAQGNFPNSLGFAAGTTTINPGGVAAVQVGITGGSGAVVYEVVNTDPAAVETATINVAVAFVSNTSQNLPALGQSTVNASFAPLSTVNTASASAPIPRFCDNSTPRNTFAINPCACNLLFPFVTNQAGFDTGIALANTSLDPFGTPTQAGTVSLFYFGNTVGGGAAPPTQTTSAVVPAGQELVFTLSNGGNFGIAATPGFQGYIISTARFQYCHAFAFISDVGAQKFAEGYLAIQLDIAVFGGFTTLNRTGIFGENEGH